MDTVLLIVCICLIVWDAFIVYGCTLLDEDIKKLKHRLNFVERRVKKWKS